MNSQNVMLFGIIAIVSLFIINPVMASVSAPICPTIFAGSDGGFEIYWFYPGLHETSIGNLSEYPADIGAPSTEGGHYAIMTRFGSEPPMVVNYAATYIAGYNPSPDSSGYQSTPLSLTLGQPAANNCFTYDRIYEVYFDSTICGLGAIVEVSNIEYTNILHDIWVGLEWPEQEQILPYIGVGYCPAGSEQLILAMGETACLVSEPQQNYMLGLKLLSWTAIGNSESVIKQFSENLSFEALFAEDTSRVLNQYLILDVTGSDSLFTSVNINEKGYLCVRAIDGIDTAQSEWIEFDPDKRPDLVVNPPLLEMTRNKITSNSYDFALANTGSTGLSVRLDYDSTLLKSNPSAMNLEPGEMAVVGLELMNDQTEDSLLNSTITILSSEDKYPILYHLKFLPPEPTGIEENGSELPAGFSVGQAHPNPFNGSVRFEINTSNDSGIDFEVFDILGRRVYHEEFIKGEHRSVTWDGRDGAGRNLASGVYFFRFSSGSGCLIRRAALIK